MGDGEDADAALGAAGMADEIMAAALVGIGYGCVYDLDECFVHCDSAEGSRFARMPTSQNRDMGHPAALRSPTLPAALRSPTLVEDWLGGSRAR